VLIEEFDGGGEESSAPKFERVKAVTDGNGNITAASPTSQLNPGANLKPLAPLGVSGLSRWKKMSRIRFAAFARLDSGRRDIASLGDLYFPETAEKTAAREDLSIAKCEVCENEYDKAFELTVAGKRHTFDSFECAIHALAPVCPHCQCRVIGHGVEQGDKIFCCVHCARSGGKTQLKDRV
jgi:hypothetical protein